MTQPEGPFSDIYRDLRTGKITRREFIGRAAGLGVGLPVALHMLNAATVDGAATPAPSNIRPSAGTEDQVRGSGGELKLLQWAAPTNASVHQAQSTGDQIAASLVQEGLVSYARDGTILANLVAEVPSMENGGLSGDLKTVTLNLLPGLVWSDGQPMTSDDVEWTWQWILDETNASSSLPLWDPIEAIEILNPTRFQVIFKEGTLAWFVPLAGTYGSAILPKHVWDGRDKDVVNQAFTTNPIGTGPYKIDSFVENDQVIYSINANYRERNKPYFANVIMKGGGDAGSAAQAVLQTGDWDVAWNVQQVDARLLLNMEANGKGHVQTSPGQQVERIMFNFSDPNTEIDGERSSVRVPHPFLTDPAVRQAMSLAIDRNAIANEFFLGGAREPAAANILTGIGSMESPNTTWEYDIGRANQILDDAGWARNGEVRSRDGIELRVTYYTTINRVRQQEQAVVKQGWEAIGIKVQLGQVDAGTFFDYISDRNSYHFYYDVQMYTLGPLTPFPLDYMRNWYAGPVNANIAQKANDWQGFNSQRYVNPAFDALLEEAEATKDWDQAAELFIKMNDIVVNDFVVIPLVARPIEKYAISNRLVNENVAAASWETLYWNIANWTTVEH